MLNRRCSNLLTRFIAGYYRPAAGLSFISPFEILELKKKITQIATQKEFVYTLLEAQEKERTQLWLQLENNISQILVAAKLFIEMAKTDERERRLYLDTSASYILEVIAEIRKISKNLTSPNLNALGLVESIGGEIDDINAVYPITIDFQADGLAACELTERLQLDIFRIVQEQLDNILQYSKASRANVRLARKTKEIILVISDNGIGCDPATVAAGGGTIHIGSRVEANRGRLDIRSKPGEGYRLTVALPLD